MTGLTPGTKYFVQITSVTAAGENATQYSDGKDASPAPAQRTCRHRPRQPLRLRRQR